MIGFPVFVAQLAAKAFLIKISFLIFIFPCTASGWMAFERGNWEHLKALYQ